MQELVRDVCDIAFGIKRHQIGLMPKERAAMAFKGSLYAVSFDNLRRLMGLGTDVVVIEKEGPTMKLIPHTKNVWIALIESQGFLVEYAIALAELCNGNWATAQTYTFDGKHSWVPRNKGNIGIISDWDYSGCMIGLQVRGAERIGIDFNTKDELNAMFSYLDLRIEDLEEPVNDHGAKVGTQWRGLVNLYNNGENDKNKLSLDEWAFYREYLSQRRDGVTYLEYLKSNRIEINTVMSAVKPRRFWEWLQWKLQQIWPNRNYNRAMDLPITTTHQQ